MSFARVDSAWIVAGMLLAIGFLFAGRWVYRKFRRRGAWALINAEREANRGHFRRSAESFATIARQLQANSAVLEPLRAGTQVLQARVTGLVAWNCDFPEFTDTAWQTVRRSGSIALFQPEQLREVEELYRDFDTLRASMASVRREIDAGRLHASAQSDEARPQRIADEIRLLQAVRVAHDKLGADMRHFTELHTDFVPSV